MTEIAEDKKIIDLHVNGIDYGKLTLDDTYTKQLNDHIHEKVPDPVLEALNKLAREDIKAKQKRGELSDTDDEPELDFFQQEAISDKIEQEQKKAEEIEDNKRERELLFKRNEEMKKEEKTVGDKIIKCVPCDKTMKASHKKRHEKTDLHINNATPTAMFSRIQTQLEKINGIMKEHLKVCQQFMGAK
jgi:hypothetical protein